VERKQSQTENPNEVGPMGLGIFVLVAFPPFLRLSTTAKNAYAKEMKVLAGVL